MSESCLAQFRAGLVTSAFAQRFSRVCSRCDYEVLQPRARSTAARRSTSYGLIAPPAPFVANFSANQYAIAAFEPLDLHLTNCYA